MRQGIIFGLSLILLCGSFVPHAAFAQSGQTCDCFCHSEDGAFLVSSAATGYETCRVACEQRGERALGCYTSEMTENRPENNQLCWREFECLSDVVPTELDENGNVLETTPSIWGGQESFCPPEQGYCYNPPNAVSEFGGSATVTLGVPIGDLKEAGDLGSYVEAIYTYLISAASILAVFLLMVGGVQYMLARGDQGAIGKAKARMASALLGLALILSAYVIARLIDPRLVDFNFFAAPKIQTIVFLDENSSCEAIQEQGVAVSPLPAGPEVGFEECGSLGLITDTSGAGANASVGLEVGDTCNYITCSDPLSSCVRDTSSSTGYSCVRCQDIYDGSGLTIDANASSCSRALSKSAVAEADAKGSGSMAACLYHDAGANDVYSKDACVEIVFPIEENVLDCDLLRQYAAEKGGPVGCRMYDLVYGRSAEESSLGLGTTTAELDWLQENDNTFSIFQDICQRDPCGVGFPGPGSCAAYISDPTAGLCSIKIPLTDIAFFGESIQCQTVGDLAYSANCYDTQYLDDWNTIVDLWENGGDDGTFGSDDFYEMQALYENLFPADEDGNEFPDPWW